MIFMLLLFSVGVLLWSKEYFGIKIFIFALNRKQNPGSRVIRTMIAIIEGTNRPSTYIEALSVHYARLLAEAGQEVSSISLPDLPREIAFHFPEMEEAVVPGFAAFQEKLDQASYLIFLVPEYNGSMPGILKLFIDACRYPDSFAGKDIALVGFSSGMFGNLRGLDHLDAVLTYLRGNTMAYRVHIPRIEEKIDGAGQISSNAVRNIILKQVEEIVALQKAD